MPDALRLWEGSIPKARRVRGPTHAFTITETQNWVSALDQARQYEKAAEVRGELLVVQRQQFPASDPRLATALSGLGSNLLRIGQFAEAEALLKECITIREQTMSDNWLLFNARTVLGGALLRQNKYAEAEPLLLSGYEGTKARVEQIPANVRKLRPTEALQRLIDLYTAWDKPDEASKFLKILNERKTAQ